MSPRSAGLGRGFVRLWLGDAVSMLGDWLTYVAVGVLAVDDGGPLGVLAVLLVYTVPRAVLAPWAGRVADRWDRRAVLCLGSAARGLSVLGMAIAAAHGQASVGVGLLVMRMALGAFVDAAAGAAVPRVVEAAALPRAHAWLGATWSVVFAVGVAAGGLVTAALGPVTALVVDALTFFAAAVIFGGLPPLRPQVAVGEPAAAGGWGEALALVRGRPAVRRASLAKVPVMIANGGAWVLMHAMVVGGGGSGAALTLGGLHVARAVGTGVGAGLWARVPALRGTTAGLRVGTAVVLAGAAVLGLAGGSPPCEPLAGLACVAWGVGVGSVWATAATRVQRLTPDPLRGRITAVDLVAHTAGQCVGGALGCAGMMALGSAGASLVGLAPALGVAIAAWAWLERGPRESARDEG